MSTLPVACAASTWNRTPFLAADGAERGDVLDHADLVVHVHDRGQDRVGTDRRLELLQVEHAVFLHVEVGDLEALALQLARRCPAPALCSVFTVIRCLPLVL
jgi:hypothetical protein